ncbi:MAG: hypothetical protein H6526_00815 [Actinobacteria bacterium]|nr:hypothetical protein [Actinomycetota bacterium]MCB0920276.1 hypothetical protein [Actinomycetota bacterium]MCB9413805.1 hypothetical protein [Actinomycetota bacterium]HRY08341.1 hypothetical protein [Candidatus Nanopelagicales bacterium]
MPRPNMRRRVDAAIKAADHLHDKDAAAIQLLRALADALDAAYDEDNGGSVYRKYAGWMSPHIMNAMRALGLTADSGPKAGFVAPEKPNALTELRARRFQRHAQGGGDVG